MPGESLSPDEIARKVLANAPPGRQTAKEAALLDFVLLDEAGQIDTTVGDVTSGGVIWGFDLGGAKPSGTTRCPHILDVSRGSRI